MTHLTRTLDGATVSPSEQSTSDSLHLLKKSIEHAAHLLPAQGPISVFIHHNTLHAFEDQNFHHAVVKGAEVFGCEAYLTEQKYREALDKGRIRYSELQAVLKSKLRYSATENVFGTTTRLDLRMAMLQCPLWNGSSPELRWFMAETDALDRVRPEVSTILRRRLIAETRHWVLRDLRTHKFQKREDQVIDSEKKKIAATLKWLKQLFVDRDELDIESWSDEEWESFSLNILWEICREQVGNLPSVAISQKPVRHRDFVLNAFGVDTDLAVHDVLIRFCAAFLDQGITHWKLPDREMGFFNAFINLYSQSFGPPDRWMGELASQLSRIKASKILPLQSVHESLAELNVPESEWDQYLSATFLALRGWGGMVHQVELRGDRVAYPAPEGSLIEFLAIRLILERCALSDALKRSASSRKLSLKNLRDELSETVPKNISCPDQRAFTLFQLSQVLGWLPEDLHGLTSNALTSLVSEIENFASIDRREVFHLAYERRFSTQVLDSLSLHQGSSQRKTPPRFQAVFCLDEREESMRRHLEEVAPDVETFGAAGFFSVAMYYRGATDAHYVPLCPVIIMPQYWVKEQVDDEAQKLHERRSRTRKTIGTASQTVQKGSRSIAFGAILTAGLGVLASIPLVARILFPRLVSKMAGKFGSLLQAPQMTHLVLERSTEKPGNSEGQFGYTLDEMTNIGERILRDIGLISNFARLILMIGHGSNSLNNPHKSAYDCGACGGNAGAPNARAIAQILNDSRVRANLVQRDIIIPTTTYFVGGFHNTCDDSITFSDCDRVPDTHQSDFEKVLNDIDKACDRNAHERCRRFVSAPLDMTFREARRHVEERSEDLAQTRPELGHATNAFCVVGRRERTQSLFMDRRCFLTSYDPTQDSEDAPILTRILGAVFPVCAGINLEYYFSHVDSPGYGCGSKLPHNVASMLGVMDGPVSDLRTGLPWQMVEIHEPVRLLIVIETTCETMLGILKRNPGIEILCRNEWVQVAVLNPDSNGLHILQAGQFVPYNPQNTSLPKAATSTEWYRGWREHLEFATIKS